MKYIILFIILITAIVLLVRKFIFVIVLLVRKITKRKGVNIDVPAIQPIDPISVMVFVLIITLSSTLPFHYCPSRECVMLKTSLSFKYTVVEEEDISKLIKNYNSANVEDRIIIGSESLYKNLVEEGIITTSNSENSAE